MFAKSESADISLFSFGILCIFLFLSQKAAKQVFPCLYSPFSKKAFGKEASPFPLGKKNKIRKIRVHTDTKLLYNLFFRLYTLFPEISASFSQKNKVKQESFFKKYAYYPLLFSFSLFLLPLFRFRRNTKKDLAKAKSFCFLFSFYFSRA